MLLDTQPDLLIFYTFLTSHLPRNEVWAPTSQWLLRNSIVCEIFLSWPYQGRSRPTDRLRPFWGNFALSERFWQVALEMISWPVGFDWYNPQPPKPSASSRRSDRRFALSLVQTLQFRYVRELRCESRKMRFLSNYWDSWVHTPAGGRYNILDTQKSFEYWFVSKTYPKSYLSDENSSRSGHSAKLKLTDRA